MIEESKYYSDVGKKHFNKELVMTKEDNEGFENFTKRWICDNDYVDYNVKVKGHCYITEKHRISAFSRLCPFYYERTRQIQSFLKEILYQMD